jgi:hypothetical protein
LAALQYADAGPMSRPGISPGISQDIRRVRRPTAHGIPVPLPSDMPRRVHQLPQAPAAVRSAPSTAPSKSKRSLKLWEYAQYPLIALLSLGAAASSTFGQAVILGYALAVLIRRKPSRLSFGLALILLITIPLFQGIGQPSIAENAAIYVYELLVVGTISAILELKKT